MGIDWFFGNFIYNQSFVFVILKGMGRGMNSRKVIILNYIQSLNKLFTITHCSQDYHIYTITSYSQYSLHMLLLLLRSRLRQRKKKSIRKMGLPGVLAPKVRLFGLTSYFVSV